MVLFFFFSFYSFSSFSHFYFRAPVLSLLQSLSCPGATGYFSLTPSFPSSSFSPFYPLCLLSLHHLSFIYSVTFNLFSLSSLSICYIFNKCSRHHSCLTTSVPCLFSPTASRAPGVWWATLLALNPTNHNIAGSSTGLVGHEAHGQIGYPFTLPDKLNGNLVDAVAWCPWRIG